ncbi:MAG: pyridoxamine 5'-phosphate oxidase [Steroidobacteraceae bacterium]
MAELHHTELLPDPLPREPLQLAAVWLAQACERRAQPNPDAMVLASANAVGQPSARVVLCKGIVVTPGYVRFVSNYESRKGHELELNPRAALVMHWDHAHRQVRIEGRVLRASAADSDAYFAARGRGSQIGAWASAQSQPLNSREALQAAIDAQSKRFVDTSPIPRPPWWGMYHLWVEAVELWSEGDARNHDRARWQRDLQPDITQCSVGPWHAIRLQP